MSEEIRNKVMAHGASAASALGAHITGHFLVRGLLHKAKQGTFGQLATKHPRALSRLLHGAAALRTVGAYAGTKYLTERYLNKPKSQELSLGFIDNVAGHLEHGIRTGVRLAGRYTLKGARKGEIGIRRAFSGAAKFVKKYPALTATGAGVGYLLHKRSKSQELSLSLQEARGSDLELGFLKTAMHVVNTVRGHAPKIVAATKRTTFGATASKMRASAPVAGSYFDKATAMCLSAFNTAKKGASLVHTQTFAKDKPMQSFRRGGPNLLKTAYRNKGKIAIGVGAGGALASANSFTRPPQAPEEPKPKPVRFQVR